MYRNKDDQILVSVPLVLDGEQLSRSLSYEGALKLMTDIDLGFQDAGFTEELITKLVNSLKTDYTTEEINDFIDGLKK